MTWSANMKVQFVADGEVAPTEVIAVANGDDITYDGEGNLATVELHLMFGEAQVPFKLGDSLTVSGDVAG